MIRNASRELVQRNKENQTLLVTERTERELSGRLERVSRALSEILNLRDLLDLICRESVDVFKTQAAFLWLLAHWQRWNWVGSVMLLASVGAAALGLWLGLLPGLMLVAAVAVLLGWDLSGFLRRIRLASPTDDVRGIERRHLLRIGIVAFLSAAIAALSLFVQIKVPFEIAVLLVLVSTVGLTRLAAWLQHENEL